MNTVQKELLNANLAKIMRPPIIWMNTLLLTERSETDLISFMLLWFLIPCTLIFCISAIMGWDTMFPSVCTILLEGAITGESYINLVLNTCLHAQNVNR